MNILNEYYGHQESTRYSENNKAKHILFDIFKDLAYREGFDEVWKKYDNDEKEDILKAYLNIIQINIDIEE